jgi:hypothetical protein
MDYNNLKERIKKHEGFVNKIYKDSLGFATIGYGHLVTKADTYEEGVEYTEEELSKVFDQDFIIAGHGAETLMNNNEVYEIDHEAKCVIYLTITKIVSDFYVRLRKNISQTSWLILVIYLTSMLYLCTLTIQTYILLDTN